MDSSDSDPTIDCDFPNCSKLGYMVTSCSNSSYNCIAWAVGDTKRKWWPGPFKIPGVYWPPSIRCDTTLEAFIEMFSKICGYETWEPENGNLDEGYEKIAIYARSGTPTHAARQLSNGNWASKIG